MTGSGIIDSDGHILEPRDLWEQYLETKYADRAIRIARGEDGAEQLIVDGNVTYIPPASLGGISVAEEEKVAFLRGERTYEESWAPGSNDPRERLAVMDDQGIDISVLYPTIGICWEGWVDDAELATAYTRAYNRWIADFCRQDNARLKGAAHLSLLDPQAACHEARRARADGLVSVMLGPDPASRAGRMLCDPELDRFWATLQELNMPMAFHVMNRPWESSMLFSNQWVGSSPLGPAVDVPGVPIMAVTVLALPVMMAFTQMMATGVFERFPALRCAVLESGATWICAWLDRMDMKYDTFTKALTPLKLRPSEYFHRQCVVSADPDESLIAACVQQLGADRFVWASDYPHIDAYIKALEIFKGNLRTLSSSDQATVLGESAARFYDFAAVI